MIPSRAPNITLVPGKPALAAGLESTFDILIRIDAPAPEAARERRLLNLGIVLDRSGSMAGRKLRRAKEAVAFAVRNMAAEDRVSLTIYDDKVMTLVTGAPVAVAGPRILELLDGVHAGQSTALHDAWVKGGLQVSDQFDPARLNRVLLVSDGLANVGETDPGVLVTRAGELFARGVSTSTVGVGSDFNEDLMIPMAESAGGSAWFVETPDDFRRIFEAELTGLRSLYGERGLMKIEPRRAGTKVLEVLNDFEQEEGGWKIGPLSHGQPMEIVARVKARGGEVGQPLDLLDLRLSWDVAGQGRFELQQLFRIGCDEPAKVDALAVNPEVDRVVHLLMAARARLEAVGQMDAGDYAAARRIFGNAMNISSRRAATLDDKEALAEAEELARYMTELEGLDSRASARKRAMYQAHLRMKRSQRQP